MVTRIGRRTLGAALREWPRWRKARWQQRHRANDGAAAIAFIVGTQRSGTTMLLEVLDRSRETTVYHEYHSAAMDDFRLRPASVINRLAAKSGATVMVLKPLTESHDLDRLLARFPDARAIWVYRSYQDVANSAIAMWPGENLEFVTAVRNGDLSGLDWRGERVNNSVLEVVRRLVTQHQIGEQEGASLFWYARNQLYFDLELQHDPRVLLARYEELVTDPRRGFREIFDHLGISFDKDFVSGVSATSLRRRPFGPIEPEVERVCDAMLERLDAARKAQASRHGARLVGV